MDVTITAKIKITPTPEQVELFQSTSDAYRRGCNLVSEFAFENGVFRQIPLHNAVYRQVRDEYGLKAQMASSVIKAVVAAYRTAKSNGHKLSLVTFKRPQLDLVYNRDYSLRTGIFSLNTLEGRVHVPHETGGMEQYFDGSWKFGTAKLVNKYGKWFLHIPMTKDIPQVETGNIERVVGVDLGINHIAATYNSEGKSEFYNGRPVKHRRAHFKTIRSEMQTKGTSSARKRIRTIGNRENRWMTDVNHRVTKALIDQHGENTLFVLEDLTGVRNSTERVRVKDRYVNVSWAFYQFRTMLEYKAKLHNCRVIVVDPAYSSQTCPKCGHTERANRNKKLHLFTCKNCRYSSNDDRIGAMNLHRKGIEYVAGETLRASPDVLGGCQPAPDVTPIEGRSLTASALLGSYKPTGLSCG